VRIIRLHIRLNAFGKVLFRPFWNGDAFGAYCFLLSISGLAIIRNVHINRVSQNTLRLSRAAAVSRNAWSEQQLADVGGRLIVCLRNFVLKIARNVMRQQKPAAK